jgi:hypothetical protein
MTKITIEIGASGDTCEGCRWADPQSDGCPFYSPSMPVELFDIYDNYKRLPACLAAEQSATCAQCSEPNCAVSMDDSCALTRKGDAYEKLRWDAVRLAEHQINFGDCGCRHIPVHAHCDECNLSARIIRENGGSL